MLAIIACLHPLSASPADHCPAMFLPLSLPPALPSCLLPFRHCRWHAAFAENDVLAMTPQILLNLLSHGIIKARRGTVASLRCLPLPVASQLHACAKRSMAGPAPVQALTQCRS